MGVQLNLMENRFQIKRFVSGEENKNREYRLDLGFDSPEEQAEAEIEYEKNAIQKVGMNGFPEDVFNNVLEYFLMAGKIREATMMVCAANFGMRFSDVCQIKLSHLLKPDGEFRNHFYINEQKTTKTRAFYINESIKAVISIYWGKYSGIKKYNDYLFTSDGNNKKYIIEHGEKIQAPISHTQFENELKKTIFATGVKLKNDANYAGGDIKLNTHSLRKLYGSKFIITGVELIEKKILKADFFVLQLLQIHFGHTSMATTQRYCEETERVWETISNHMNIGLDVLENFL